MKTKNGKHEIKTFTTLVGRALRRAGQTARKTARAHLTTQTEPRRNGDVNRKSPL